MFRSYFVDNPVVSICLQSAKPRSSWLAANAYARRSRNETYVGKKAGAGLWSGAGLDGVQFHNEVREISQHQADGGRRLRSEGAIAQGRDPAPARFESDSSKGSPSDTCGKPAGKAAGSEKIVRSYVARYRQGYGRDGPTIPRVEQAGGPRSSRRN